MKNPAEQVLVSACLLGQACRYDGAHKRDAALERELAASGLEAIPFCPEEAGGLSTPRPAASIAALSASAVLDGHSRVETDAKIDVTEAFVRGARMALEACEERGIKRAYLKERSPSCGVCQTHVAGKCVPGRGVTAELLHHAGIQIQGVTGERE